MNHLLKRFKRDIIGIVWLAMGIFFGLMLWSYSPTDPSLNSIGEGLKVQNYCGYFGSFLADIFYQMFGLASWVFVMACLRMSYFELSGRETKFDHLRWLWAVLLVLTCSSLGALYFPETKFFSHQITVGGYLGLITANSLVKVFNFLGVAVILWTMALILLVFYTEKPLSFFFRQPLQWLGWGKGVVTTAVERILSLLDPKWLVAFFKGLFPEPATVAAPTSSSLLSIESESKRVPRFTLRRKEGTTKRIAGEENFYPIDPQEGDDSSTRKTFLNLLKSRKKMEKVGEKLPAKRRVNLTKKVQRRIENWELPKLNLLEDPPYTRAKVDDKEIRHKAALLVNKLAQFSVKGEVVGVKPGPAVTMFEFKPNVDVKISKITDLADDLSLALSSESVRIIAPIPGRDVVGIETSNSVRETVYLKDSLANEKFWDDETKLPVPLGRQADGREKVVDLRKMPHLLVAGSTGSGKSVFTVSMLTSLLFRHSPKTLRLILVDPKQVDLAAFDSVPHLLMPPLREPKKAISSLRWAIKEMEKRYRSMSKFKSRGLEAFNEKVANLSQQEAAEHEEINEEMGQHVVIDGYYWTPQPYIVIVVEEFGDLMAVDKGNVEQAVVRLAQMARACGIHLVLAMQSPRKDVVTGLIKTNIPGRISFKVASKMDSRIILDESGGERLLTRGDMLFLAPGVPKPSRHHGPWLSDEEIAEVTQFWREQGEPNYDPLAMRALEGSGGGFDLGCEGGMDSSGEEDEFDDRYDEILAYVSTQKSMSASLLQRRFRIGYPRAARLIEIFESEGVVGPAQGSRPRQVLINESK